MSTGNDGSAAADAVVNTVESGTASNDAGEQWDDEAMVATMAQKKAVASTNTAELLDMNPLDLNRSEQGDIQEKLRLQENKAKLAAAREGMEKEAQRLKEAKEKKDQEATSSKPRFGAAAAGMAGPGGGKWLPPHMRGGGASMGSRFGRVSGVSNQKLDTEDENLFPDLASASAILEKQKQEGPMYKVPKKTPVGGGATWGSKAKPAKKAPEAEEAPDETKAEEAPSTETQAPEPVTEAAPAPVAAKAPIKPKKKKKKDLSTFKSK